MPEMTKLNGKNTFLWLTSTVTNLTKTAYMDFEDVYNAKVDDYNKYYKSASTDEKASMDAHLDIVTKSHTAEKKDYTAGKTELGTWPALFDSIHGFHKAKEDFQKRARDLPQEKEGEFDKSAENTTVKRDGDAAAYNKGKDDIAVIAKKHVEDVNVFKVEGPKEKEKLVQIQQKLSKFVDPTKGGYLNVTYRAAVDTFSESARKTLKELETLVDPYIVAKDKATQANEKIGTLPESAKSYFEKNTPDLKQLLVTEEDVKEIQKKIKAFNSFAEKVTAALDYGKAVNSAKSFWPPKDSSLAKQSLKPVTGVYDKALEEAASGEFGKAINALQAFKPLAEAYGAYAGMLEKPPSIDAMTKAAASLGTYFSNELEKVEKLTAPKTEDFVNGRETLQKIKDLTNAASTYSGLLRGAEGDYASLKNMMPLIGEGAKKAKEANKKIETGFADIKQAADSGHDYAAAGEAVKKLQQTLDTERVERTKLVTEDATLRFKGAPEAEMLKALGSATGPDGKNLIAALYTEFGPIEFVAVLKALDTNDKDPSASAEAIAALGKSLGASGIKALTAAFGGTTKEGEATGAMGMSTVMKKGVSPAQLAKLAQTYQTSKSPDALKQIIGEGFGGSPEVFADILLTGLKGESTDKKDFRVENLKKLTDAFGDPKELGKLIKGLTSNDSFDSSLGKGEAGKRMNKLVSGRFEGDPAKLKDPFFDSLDGLKTQHTEMKDEMEELKKKKQALDDYNNLSEEGRKNKKAPTFTTKEADRLRDLKKLLEEEHYQPMALDDLIRTASTFAVKPITTNDTKTTVVDLNGNDCYADNIEHFLTRHTRDHFPFGGEALAPESTSPLDNAHKPTTLWPDGTDSSAVKTYLSDAIKALGTSLPDYDDIPGLPPAGEDFGQKDTTITVNKKSLQVRLGFKRQKGTKKLRITQFYPKSSGSLDSVPFEDMHGIRKALDV